MSEETINSFFQGLKERLSSPLYGTLIISWLVINWKIPYVTLFENNETLGESRISFITTYSKEYWWCIFILPLVSSALFIYIMPFLNNHVFGISRKHQNNKIKKQLEIDGERPLPIEEANELRTENLRLQDQIDINNVTYKQQIESLESQLNVALSKNSFPNNFENKNDNNNIHLLVQKIIANEKATSFQQAMSDVDGSSWNRETSDLRYFTQLGLIEVVKSSNSSKEKVYKFTDYGNEVKNYFAINHL